jgi:hypothetical protein
MSDLADNALIDYDEYLELVGIDPDNVNLNEDRIMVFINSASQQIEDYCDRKFVTPSADIVETFDGDGESEYFVNHRRIASGSTPSFDYRISTTWTANNVSSYPISWDSDKGKIWFVKFNRTFHTGNTNWRVSYKYGWTRADIPADMKLACAELAKRAIMLLDGKEGLASESFGDSSTSYNLPTALPDNIKLILNGYRAVSVG